MERSDSTVVQNDSSLPLRFSARWFIFHVFFLIILFTKHKEKDLGIGVKASLSLSLTAFEFGKFSVTTGYGVPHERIGLSGPQGSSSSCATMAFSLRTQEGNIRLLMTNSQLLSRLQMFGASSGAERHTP